MMSQQLHTQHDDITPISSTAMTPSTMAMMPLELLQVITQFLDASDLCKTFIALSANQDHRSYWIHHMKSLIIERLELYVRCVCFAGSDSKTDSYHDQQQQRQQHPPNTHPTEDHFELQYFIQRFISHLEANQNVMTCQELCQESFLILHYFESSLSSMVPTSEDQPLLPPPQWPVSYQSVSFNGSTTSTTTPTTANVMLTSPTWSHSLFGYSSQYYNAAPTIGKAFVKINYPAPTHTSSTAARTAQSDNDQTDKWLRLALENISSCPTGTTPTTPFSINTTTTSQSSYITTPIPATVRACWLPQETIDISVRDTIPGTTEEWFQQHNTTSLTSGLLSQTLNQGGDVKQNTYQPFFIQWSYTSNDHDRSMMMNRMMMMMYYYDNEIDERNDTNDDNMNPSIDTYTTSFASQLLEEYEIKMTTLVRQELCRRIKLWHTAMRQQIKSIISAP